MVTMTPPPGYRWLGLHKDATPAARVYTVGYDDLAPLPDGAERTHEWRRRRNKPWPSSNCHGTVGLVTPDDTYEGERERGQRT